MSIGSFSRSITVYRRLAPTYTMGRAIPGAESSFVITGSIQPVSGNELNVLPESIRQSGLYAIYTNFALRTTNQTTKDPADQLELNGQRYTVIFLEAWQNNVINHYKAFVSRADD